MSSGSNSRVREFEEYVDYARDMLIQRSPKKIKLFNHYLNIMREEGNEDHWIYKGKYVCRLHRSPYGGSWCGYVGVPLGHPIYEIDYNYIEDMYPDLNVHGGLTYSDFRHEWAKDNIWFVGFDTAHAFDINLMNLSFMYMYKDMTYKDKIWVTNETNALAKQLMDIEENRKIKKK